MIFRFNTHRQRERRKSPARPRWISHRVIGALTALCLSLVMLSADLYAGSAVITDKHIRARLALMRDQKAALLTLSDMSAGRRTFTPQRARAARRVLIENTRKIPRHFAKERLENNSHARPEIWAHWQDFETRAEAARQAAKQINASSISGLRRSLPTMMQACQSCHQIYRTVPNRAITH
ncbi:cytochrome c [Pseudophaeobacter sp. EL27]|uniref:c-type cytochrome n=1 Tax=Pseudophaeobacter sp. EL27 TaxID=2107580 RepID=UPI000EFC851E|nr:cytochrome c [Pseudophaeobacter sp. EL27]